MNEIRITMEVSITAKKGLSLVGTRHWHNGKSLLHKKIGAKEMEQIQYPLTRVLEEVKSLAESLITQN